MDWKGNKILFLILILFLIILFSILLNPIKTTKECVKRDECIWFKGCANSEKLSFLEKIKANTFSLAQKSWNCECIEGICKPSYENLDCNIKREDPNGYLLKTCEHIKENHIEVYPAIPKGYKVTRTIHDYKRRNFFKGRDVVFVWLYCSGQEDYAIIDKETGEVLGFIKT